MGVQDWLTNIDHRAGLRHKPGAAPVVVPPLSRGRVRFLRWVGGTTAVCLLGALVLVVVNGPLWLPLLFFGPLLQLLVLHPDHRRQILGRSPTS